jgi:quinol monooxygenase YgiN
MAKIAIQRSAKNTWVSNDSLYATAIIIWIFAIWGTALYIASEAEADASAGVGGNSFLLACSLATAGVITAFSIREFLGAYKRLATETDRLTVELAKEESPVTKLGLLVALEAQPGKEMQLANFLTGALPLVEAEAETTAWFAIQMGPSTFGIFDAFPDESGREAHLSGEIAKALMAKARDLLAKPPSIEKVDILANKLPNYRA